MRFPVAGRAFGRGGAARGTLLGLALAGLARSAAAQTDYRNLDNDRPAVTEDAYPVERYAFEFQVPYVFESEADGANLHATVPELAYGILDNAQIGIQVPFAAVNTGGDTQWGLAGFQPYAFYNFNTETRRLPAFSLRTDLSLPVGSLAGDATRVTVKAIATRSWGLTRVHLNAAHSFGSEDQLAAVHPASRWLYSAAVDRTILRRSLLLVGEVAVLRTVADAPTEVNAGLGARYQWSPTLVLDLGVRRRLAADGPDVGLTFGVSYAFAVRGLMRSGAR